MNIDYSVQTSKVSAVNGLPKFNNEKLDCESCKLAKTKRVSFKPIGRIRSTRPLQLVHMDVCGPLPVVSCGGAKYFLPITDDFSRMVTCFPLKGKSQVFV
ncbi:copia protein [Trichonephila clavipes]|nr:copia protein [Trichonephila clavipes]